MSKLGKIVKDTVKAKKESVMGKLGDSPYEDPMEPWSAKYNAPIKEDIESLDEESVLYRYIRSKGYSPEHMDFAHRSAFARSRAFKTFKAMHQNKKETPQGGISDIKAEEAVMEVSNAEMYKTSAETSKAKLAAMKAMDVTRKYEKERLEKDAITEAGVGKLMNFIKAKGVDPSTMDGNQKKNYSRSSEFRIFKIKHKEIDDKLEKMKDSSKKKVNETSGMGERGDDWNEETGSYVKVSKIKKKLKESVDRKDTVTMDIPLLIRVLEYAREDAKTDMDLHKVVENLINMRGKGSLTMDQYNKIVSIKEEIEKLDEISKELANRYYWASKSDHDKTWDEISKGQEKQSKQFSMRRHNKITKLVNKSQKRSQGKLRALERLNKEETEQIDELKSTTYTSYINKVTDPEVASKRGKTPSGTLKSIKAIGGVSKAIGKRAKAQTKELKELKKMPDNMDADDHITRESVQEGIGGIEDSPLSATNSVKAMESARMKSARMIKSIYKKKLKESTYDWEKDDKSVNPVDPDRTPSAKIIMKGGKTLTGKPRDTVEIEPVLKTRPNSMGGTKPNV